jgi:hypothetical protein
MLGGSYVELGDIDPEIVQDTSKLDKLNDECETVADRYEEPEQLKNFKKVTINEIFGKYLKREKCTFFFSIILSVVA